MKASRKALYRSLQNCPLCGRFGLELGGIRTYIAPWNEVVDSNYSLCGYCDFVWTNNPPTGAELEEYYSANDQYRRAGMTAEEAHHICDQISFLNPEPGRHLEIGPDNGTFLDLMRHRISGEFYFSEMNVEANERLRNKGYRPDDGGFYQSITMRHVLEHIPDPVPLIASLKSRAKIIFVEVPDYSTLADGASDGFQFEHVNYFSITSMHVLAKQAGLSIKQAEFVSTPGYSTTPNRVMRAKLVPSAPHEGGLWSALLREDVQLMERFSQALIGRVAIYGAGTITSMLLAASTSTKAEVVAIYDIDQKKQGRKMLGATVQPPENIDPKVFDVLVLTVVGYEREVRDFLKGRVPDEKIKTLREFVA